MKNSHNFFLVLSLFLVLTSCNKEDKNRSKMAGVYDVVKFEQSWYTNDMVDSTTVLENAGWLGLYQNGGDAFDRISPSSTFTAGSLSGVSATSTINWTVGRVSNSTITFYDFPNTGIFVRYTINGSPKTKMTWTYVVPATDSTLQYKEVITLKRSRK